MSSFSLNLRKDSVTIHTEVLTNIVKMLAYRNWISDDPVKIKQLIDKLVSNKNEDYIYTIKLDKSLLDIETYDPYEDKVSWKTNKNTLTGWNNFDGTTIVILLFHQTVSGKSPLINEFLAKYSNMHRILIINEISDKARQNIEANKHTEVFKECEMMMCLVEHVASPDYELLTPAESDEICESYGASLNNLGGIYDFDPAARFMYMKRRQVTRIIHKSSVTALAVSYRVVKHKGYTG